MTTCRYLLPRMRNVSDKSCRKDQNTHFMFNNVFLRKSCRLWDNVEKYGGAKGATNDVTICRIQVACWISWATCTHAHAHAHARTHKYVPLIAFPRQQWLHKAHLNFFVICTLPVLCRNQSRCKYVWNSIKAHPVHVRNLYKAERFRFGPKFHPIHRLL